MGRYDKPKAKTYPQNWNKNGIRIHDLPEEDQLFTVMSCPKRMDHMLAPLLVWQQDNFALFFCLECNLIFKVDQYQLG